MNIKRVFAGALGTTRSPGRKERPGAAMQSAQSMLQFNRWSIDKTFAEGYGGSPWVYACVNAIARDASSVPWRVSEFADHQQKSMFLREREGVPPSQVKDFMYESHHVKRRFTGEYRGMQPIYERKTHLLHVPDDPFEQLLADPNPFTTRQEFMERMGQHLLLAGDSINYMIRSKVDGVPGYKTPFELWSLFPQNVEIDREGQVPIKYRYFAEGKQGVNEAVGYEPEDIVHVRMTAPGDSVRGMSPLMAAARGVDTDSQAAVWQLNSMRHRAVPDMLISFKDKLDPKSYASARRMMRENREGTGSDGARSPWMLGNQAQIQQLSLTPIEMDYIKTRALSRQEICTIYNVYLPAIAVMEGYGVASIEPILKHHWVQSVIPFLDKLMAVVNKRIGSQFPGDTLAWFDPSNVEALNENLMERMRMQKVVHTEGVPFAELNRRFDLGFDVDNIPSADVGFFPAGVVPDTVAMQGESDNEPGNPNTSPEGGDPGEPGGDVEPNSPEPEDGDVEQEVRQAMGRYHTSAFSNGHSDPHDGVRRWSSEEVNQLLEEAIMTSGALMPELDHYEVWLASGPLDEIRELATDPLQGVEVIDQEEGVLVRFYHGESTQKRRDDVVDHITNRWGWVID